MNIPRLYSQDRGYLVLWFFLFLLSLFLLLSISFPQFSFHIFCSLHPEKRARARHHLLNSHYPLQEAIISLVSLPHLSPPGNRLPTHTAIGSILSLRFSFFDRGSSSALRVTALSPSLIQPWLHGLRFMIKKSPHVSLSFFLELQFLSLFISFSISVSPMSALLITSRHTNC